MIEPRVDDRALVSTPAERAATVGARTSRGAVWGIAVSAGSAPLAFGVILILARVSPDALGFYALVTLLMSAGSTFLAVGGPSVASRFTPRIGSVPNSVTVFQALGGASLAFLCAVVLSLVIDAPLGIDGWALVFLAPAVSLWVGLQGALTAQLRFGLSTAVQNLPTAFQFLFLAGVVGLFPVFTRHHAHGIVVASYLIPLSLIAAIYLARLVGFIRSGAFGARLPAGFWRYVVGIQVIVLLAFVFETAERGFAVVLGGGLSTLGLYFAAFQTAQIVRRVPAIIGQAFLPGFASLAAQGHPESLHRASSRVVGAIGFVTGTALALSRGLVGPIFGSAYNGVGIALALLAIAYAATAVSPLDCSYATATDRLGLYQLGLVGGLFAFVPLAFFNTVTAFAASRALALLVLQLIVCLALPYVRRFRVRHVAACLAIGGAEALAAARLASPVGAVAIWALGVVLYWRVMHLAVPGYSALHSVIRGSGVERA